MASAASLTIDVEMKTARMAAGAEKAKKILRDVRKESEGGLAGGVKGFADQFKVVEQLGKAFVALELAGKGISIVSHAIRGEWDEVDKDFKSLPLGVGTLYSGFREIRDVIFNTKKETEDFKKKLDALNEGNKIRGEVESVFDNAKKSFEDRAKQSLNSSKLLGYGDDDVAKAREKMNQDIAEIARDRDAKIKEIKDKAKGDPIAKWRIPGIEEAANKAITARRIEGFNDIQNEQRKIAERAAEEQKRIQDKLAEDVKRKHIETGKEAAKALQDRQKKLEDNVKEHNPLFNLAQTKKELDELSRLGLIDQKQYQNELNKAFSDTNNPATQLGGFSEWKSPDTIDAGNVEDKELQQKLLANSDALLLELQRQQQQQKSDFEDAFKSALSNDDTKAAFKEVLTEVFK